MNLVKQTLILSQLITSPDLYALTSGILKGEYFDPEVRNAVFFIHEYYNKYNNLPNAEEILAETGTQLSNVSLEPHQYDYILDSIEEFCKQKACESAILKSVELMEKGDRSGIVEVVSEAANVSLHRDMGLNYFLNPTERITRSIQQNVKISTGFKSLDNTLNGGFLRPGLHIFSANSGGGKSLVMSNVGLNMIERGYNVLYVTLELDEMFVGARFDTMISGIPEAEISYKKQEVIDKILFKNHKSGQLHIKYMDAQSKTDDIKNFIIQFGMLNKFYPDCLIVDYLDLVAPNSNRYDGAFERDKMTSEQLRNLAKEFNFSVITASQQNRDAINATVINQSHIAGGISKINTCDLAVSINFNEETRAAGEIHFTYTKTRYSAGEGKTETLTYNPISMRITDPSSISIPSQSQNNIRNNCSLIDHLDI